MIEGQAKKEGKVTIFQVRDDLTSERVKSFLKRIDEIISSGNLYIILDLSHVEETSMLALVAISSLSNQCRQSGGILKVAGLQSQVRRAFRRTNLINTVEVYDEVLDAIRSFKSQNLLKGKGHSGSFYVKDLNAFVPWDRLPLVGQIH